MNKTLINRVAIATVCDMARPVAVLLTCLTPLAAAGFPSDLLKKPDAWYGSEDGKRTTACVLSWQSEQGSWPKAKKTALTMNSAPGGKLDGTFDNKSTTDELRYLARAYPATKDEGCKKAFLLGFDHILKAQYANGGWPQYYPVVKKGYPSHITFNDGSMVRLMEFLEEVSTDNAYLFVDADRRAAAAKAIDRGVDCIVKCQIVVAGKPTVWCAQHDEVTFAPALARAYELPSFSGSESAGIVRYLMTIEKPSPEVIRAVKGAAAWFESAVIKGIRIETIHGDRQVIEDAAAPPLWARFYDLETGKPFVCDRDGVKKSQLSEIGEERRNRYAWYGAWGESVAREYAKWPHR
jgi:PelA/Pel-15E family pectate lyase